MEIALVESDLTSGALTSYIQSQGGGVVGSLILLQPVAGLWWSMPESEAWGSPGWARVWAEQGARLFHVRYGMALTGRYHPALESGEAYVCWTDLQTGRTADIEFYATRETRDLFVQVVVEKAYTHFLYR